MIIRNRETINFHILFHIFLIWTWIIIFEIIKWIYKKYERYILIDIYWIFYIFLGSDWLFNKPARNDGTYWTLHSKIKVLNFNWCIISLESNKGKAFHVIQFIKIIWLKQWGSRLSDTKAYFSKKIMYHECWNYKFLNSIWYISYLRITYCF